MGVTTEPGTGAIWSDEATNMPAQVTGGLRRRSLSMGTTESSADSSWPRKLSDDELMTLKQEWVAGTPVLEIGHQLGIPEHAVRKWARRSGLAPRRKPGSRVTPSQRITILCAAAEGMTHYRVAKELGLNISTVKYQVKTYGHLPIEELKTLRDSAAERDRILREEWIAGTPIDIIAKRMSVKKY